MAFLENYIGDTSASYTATQYYKGETPRLGDWFFNHVNHRKYVFLRNSAATAIAPSIAVTSADVERAYAPTTGSAASFTATPSCKVPGTTLNLAFAGVRDVGATNVAQNECGWFAVSGGCTFTADATGSTAEKIQVTSATTAGNVITISTTYAAAMGPGVMIGIARTTTTSGAVVVDVTSNVWGI